MSETDTKGWHVVRFTLTALSPLSCGAGEGIDADNAIARDANGLPMIPGATLQGLLRRELEEADAEVLLGSSEKAGRILFSNGAVHGSDNVAVFAGVDVESDEVLSRLSALVPLKRDHVRLDHRHGAADAGKFDRAAVPKGTRFSFELLMFGKLDEAESIPSILSPLTAPWFRVGSSGSKGYGRVKLDSVCSGFFAKEQSEKFGKLRGKPLSNVSDLTDVALLAAAAPLCIEISLTPINPWRTGQDGVRNGAGRANEKEAKLTPVREVEIREIEGRLSWTVPQKGQTEQYVLPGSSLRGPLAHRTLFHWNRGNGGLIDVDAEDAEQTLKDRSERAKELQTLFGFAREGGNDTESGLASPLLFEDVKLIVNNVIQADHVKIDRFTGGATPKALFAEELVATETLTTCIYLRQDIDEKARVAFTEALRDLCEGRLALGAKSHGFFEGGTLQFSGSGATEWQTDWPAIEGAIQ